MKILFLGDIYASGGRETVKKILPKIKDEHSPDLIIANAENLTHGNGFSLEHINQMRSEGIDFFTSGNHFMGVKDGVMKLDDPNFPVIRPANYPPTNVPGRGYHVFEDGMMNKILIINMIGRVFMKQDFDCPFRKMDEILRETAHENLSAIFVDFHAETTSEKMAFALYLDGKVSAVVGTHTHVATKDARILEDGTAYISDVGFIGPLDSVIGVKKDIIINSFISQVKGRHEPETHGPMVFNSVLIEVDEKTKKALTIEHVQHLLSEEK